MENKKTMKIVYVIFLLAVYHILLKLTGFSVNTAAYGLFLSLIFFYSITENLNFLTKTPKINTLFVNAFIFGIFFIFYKNLSIFLTFILFTIIQMFLYRIIVKISNKEKIYYIKLINKRSIIKLLIDSFAIIITIFGVCYFKYEELWYISVKKEYLYVYLGVFLVGYIYTRMNEKSWSFSNTIDTYNLIVLNLLSSIVFLVVLQIVKDNLPKFLILFIFILSLSLQLFFRYIFVLKRYYFKRNRGSCQDKRILIYGAGEAGSVIARESLRNQNFNSRIVGFLDDDEKKIGTDIYNIKVLGSIDTLEEITKKMEVEEIIIAIPSLNSEKIKDIVEKIEKVKKIKIKILPLVSSLVEGGSLINQVREIKIEDLLGRKEIEVNSYEITNLIKDKVIFVTGGAGSIGSELSRQLAKHSPLKLINIDINENDIYFLELEMKRKFPDLNLISEICNVREKSKLEFLFEKYKPNLVFHAAAHKHVPLMEHNPEEAIKNNIFGTKNVAECADKYKVERMVLVSTDKAVNPTNIMGATKRACELIIQDMSKKSEFTKYMAVRFGNVLGSNGSVIPIFSKLLEEGKNLTITHKDITRYFMTIPEAAQLVIEAGSLGKGGEIFILDMGEPIKIYDLAKTMIRLSNSDVGIDIIGLRPGEKLYEELLYDVNSAIKTNNKKIFITKIEDGKVNIGEYYEKLSKIIERPNIDEIKKIMKELVVSYKEVKY